MIVGAKGVSTALRCLARISLKIWLSRSKCCLHLRSVLNGGFKATSVPQLQSWSQKPKMTADPLLPSSALPGPHLLEDLVVQVQVLPTRHGVLSGAVRATSVSELHSRGFEAR